jgi:hypothetical protein
MFCGRIPDAASLPMRHKSGDFQSVLGMEFRPSFYATAMFLRTGCDACRVQLPMRIWPMEARMKGMDVVEQGEWGPGTGLETPFAEHFAAEAPADSRPSGFEVWSNNFTPFAEAEETRDEAELEQVLFEALTELRDEGFHEAVSFLAEETEGAINERFVGETSLYGEERERFAQSYLSGVQFEAEQYAHSLETGLAGLDVASFTVEQLDETLNQLDPALGELTPAGEEFIGKFIKKAKKAVKSVVAKAKVLGKLAAPFLQPLLKKLRALIQPLIKRVLSFAIGRLPAPLQPAARQLADKLLSKVAPTAARDASSASADAPDAAPTTKIDTDTVADSFDMQLAEAIAYSDGLVAVEEQFADTDRNEPISESHELQLLAEARGALIDQIKSAQANESLAPAIEQFIPAILTALRTGVRLIGRPRVVGFLAGYVAKFIQKWVDPEAAKPLANAIVDAGLKLMTLEAENGTAGLISEAAPAAIASVIEDTIRRLSENEDYVLDNEDLTQIAVAEAFGEAVATYFPQDQVRGELQLAPSLGGTFVSRNPRSYRSYAKYNRAPEIQLTSRVANALPAFGGTTVGAAMRAQGAQFPMRARMHMYQAKAGSTMGSMMRHDRRNVPSNAGTYPLTPYAAGLLLREPGLGSAVSAQFLRSRRRLAAGQRFFVLEPLEGMAMQPNGAPSPRLAPGRAWISVNPSKARISLGFYVSEAEAQRLAQAMRSGQGHGDLLKTIIQGFRSTEAAQKEAEGPTDSLHEDGEDFEDFSFRAGKWLPHGFKRMLRRRIGAWAMPAIAAWLRTNGEAFLRAADHPDLGVRIKVRLDGVPGIFSRAGGAIPSLDALAKMLRGNPAVTVAITPGQTRQ